MFKVTVDRLNIRGGPGTEFEKIETYGPLNKGQVVEELEEEGKWVFVELIGGQFNGNRGYVHSNFLTPA